MTNVPDKVAELRQLLIVGLVIKLVCIVVCISDLNIFLCADSRDGKCLTGLRISVNLHEVLVSILNVSPENLKVCIHPALSACHAVLKKNSLYCFTSCVDPVMQQTAAFDCHRTDLLLRKDAVDQSCVQLSEMNIGILCSTECALLSNIIHQPPKEAVKLSLHSLSAELWQNHFKEHFSKITRYRRK